MGRRRADRSRPLFQLAPPRHVRVGDLRRQWSRAPRMRPRRQDELPRARGGLPLSAARRDPPRRERRTRGIGDRRLPVRQRRPRCKRNGTRGLTGSRVPPPLRELAAFAGRSDETLSEKVGAAGNRISRRDALYGLLRREQAIVASGASSSRSEVSRILDFAQAAYGDLVGILVGRDDRLLDSAWDGEWSLRDVMRHAIAVELRYAAQVEYSARRAETDPIGIPAGLLPCDRLSPPEPEFAHSRDGAVVDLLELLGNARAGGDVRLAKVPDSAFARPSLWGTMNLDVRMRLHPIAAHRHHLA